MRLAWGMLAAAGLWAMSRRPPSGHRPPQPRYRADERGGAAADGRHEAQRHQPDRAGEVERQAQHRATEQKRAEAEERHRGREHVYWWITGAAAVFATIGTLAAAGFAAGAYNAAVQSVVAAEKAVVETRRQADTAQEQLVASTRPWIKVASVANPHVDVLEDSVLIALTAEIANLGQSPAQGAFINTKLLPNSITPDETAAVAALCDAPAWSPFLGKRTVFPGDKPAIVMGATITADEIREQRDKSRRDQIEVLRSYVGRDAALEREREFAPEPLHAGFSFLGCVNYVVPGSAAPGQAAFIARVEPPCERGTVGRCQFDLSRPGRFQGEDATVRLIEAGTLIR